MQQTHPINATPKQSLTPSDVLKSTVTLLCLSGGAVLTVIHLLPGSPPHLPTTIGEFFGLWKLVLTPVPADATVELILLYYASFILVAAGVFIVVIGGATLIAPSPPSITDLTITPVQIAGIVVVGALEEVIFRGLPLVAADLLNVSPLILVGTGTVVWALLHERAQWPLVAVTGVFMGQLWLVGLGNWAIALHACHNGIVTAADTVP